MAHGGAALGRHEGKVVFVPYVIPGEEVLVAIVEDKGRYARGRLVDVLSPSTQRVLPPCPHFGSHAAAAAVGCGGCHWQHIAYEAQLEFKQRIVQDQLERIGRFESVLVKPTIGSPEPWYYRNHVQFALDEHGRLGFIEAERQRVVPIEECYIMHPLLDEVFGALDLEMPELERLSLRCGVNTGQKMAVFETHEDEPFELEVDLPVSCVFLLSDGRTATLIGQEYISEILAGHEYRISASSFFQINTPQAEELVHLVRDYLAPTGSEVLLDAYCGVGVFGLSLASEVGQVIGVEESPIAVADARFNAGLADNVEFVEGRVEEVLPSIGVPIDLAVLDPPRQGCASEVLTVLARLAPAKIVYVSCDPATLARDTRRLVQAGYQLVEVQPLDMFPQTYHIESVALLRR
ncbi:MAG: 23S rRNA (uracil(1939)-C(5))-methyltransferase RlmD [Anaerolineales bacterium]|nr:MAG: 23S rRNA (uracil(1939)-C(5))-methyltransferase RlmD [Anaerolineales bacterium]